MKILVFSDAHGEIRGMERAIRTHEMDTDAILYLGDGTAAAEMLLGQFPNIMHMAVQWREFDFLILVLWAVEGNGHMG